jgi:hypothetical protein
VASLRIELGYDELDEFKTSTQMPDQALRRYIARRLYLAWEHGSLDQLLSFETTDEALTGARPQAFLRNLQLLEQEGYLELSRSMGTSFSSFSARPTARLIREVERYGAAEGDVESEADYGARLGAPQALQDEQNAIMAERRRYRLARTPDEIVSVFRAVMPILEGVVRRVLRAHGSEKQYGSLGQMIGELRTRSIGTLGIWSQLNAVLTNGRDISLHGEELPVAVLRIVTESCFELFPQLVSLFPDPSA